LSVFSESPGFSKAAPRQSQFQPTDGKAIMFSDVHGVDEVKEVCCVVRLHQYLTQCTLKELQDIVQFLKDPAAFATLGGKLPKGVLLTGFVFSALRFTRSHPLLVHLGRVKLCLREQLRAKPVSHFSLLLGELKNILSA